MGAFDIYTDIALNPCNALHMRTMHTFNDLSNAFHKRHYTMLIPRYYDQEYMYDAAYTPFNKTTSIQVRHVNDTSGWQFDTDTGRLYCRNHRANDGAVSILHFLIHRVLAKTTILLDGIVIGVHQEIPMVYVYRISANKIKSQHPTMETERDPTKWDPHLVMERLRETYGV
jgi:hypothetical protein